MKKLFLTGGTSGIGYSILEKLFEKKKNSLKDNNQFIRKGKTAKYLEQKGFESNLIWELINRDK